MINNCPCCDKLPALKTLVSCDNDKCPEYGEAYFVWDWQARIKSESGEYDVKLD